MSKSVAMCLHSVDVAPCHERAELGELFDLDGGARVMVADAAVAGREAERQRHVELVESAHLLVEPGERVGPVIISPAEPGPELLHAELAEPRDALGESWVAKVEP